MKKLYKKIARMLNKIFKQNWTGKRTSACGHKSTKKDDTAILFTGDKTFSDSINDQLMTSIKEHNDWTAAEATAYGYMFTQNATSTRISYMFNKSAFTGNKIIPNSIDDKPVTNIRYDTFQACPGLTSITSNSPNFRVENQRYLIQNSNNSLIAFAPKDVTSATIPSSVTSIGDSVFEDCTGLTSIVIPSSVTSIGERAFRKCSGLTNIVIPSSVTSVGRWAFAYSKLTSISIPYSITSIGYGAFDGYTELASITSNSPNFRVENQRYLIQNDNNCLIAVAAHGITSAVIPDSVTSIKTPAFRNRTDLTTVNIPSQVTSIGASTFDGCSGLSNIVLPDAMTYIEYFTFCGCTGLTNITIPSSVTGIGDWAFSDCTGPISINIAKPANSLAGAPWGAPNATVNWNYKG